ncbi:unnamed protein product, partial [Adineta steineri]
MFNILISFFKKKLKTDKYVAGADDSSMFGLIRNQIKERMDLCNEELIEKLHSSDYNDFCMIVFSAWKTEQESRQKYEEREKTVLRNNQIQEILVTDVVVGDICVLKAGGDGLRHKNEKYDIALWS